MKEFAGSAARAAQGSKPSLVFCGELFETDAARSFPSCTLLALSLPIQAFRTAKSLLTDLFRGRVVPALNLRGLDRVLLFTATPGVILLRQCVTTFRRSGTPVPRVHLSQMGPSLDLRLRRLREPPLEMRKEAFTAAKEPKRRKNVGTDSLVGTVGRVFVPRQEIDEMALTKPKGVKRGRRDAAIDAKAAARADGGDGEDGGDEAPTFGEYGDGLGDNGERGAGEAVVRPPGPRKRGRAGRRAAPEALPGGGVELSAGNAVAPKRKRVRRAAQGEAS